MAIYQGDTKIAGNAKVSSLPLFTTQWQDHITNDASWVRSETFSWQSGAVYVSAYNHLVADISGITSETETVAGTTITFYRADDGHKIVLPDQETNVSTIYTATGMAWYYVLDTTNTRFKLPRSTHGNIVEKYQNGTEWYCVWSDGWCEQGGQVSIGTIAWVRVTFLKPFTNTNYNIQASYLTTTGTFVNSSIGIIKYANTYADMSVYGSGFDASWRACGYVSNPPENAQYKYLYFYVGNTVQDQTTIDVGRITDALNGKVDLPTGGTQTSVGLLVESYSSGTSWYRVYSDGWCEQGGVSSGTAEVAYSASVVFVKQFANADYTLLTQAGRTNNDLSYINNQSYVYSKSATGFSAICYGDGSSSFIAWEAKGYLPSAS